ncbi:unnamed protein product [Polarella glacialis]|uniref:SET domain-containing protein n=1 Tax=Polarella glacialis TaxID=89957 RepID=A0A813E8L0_POLGL|nr:unnamed protein product [Polarella glacialis]
MPRARQARRQLRGAGKSSVGRRSSGHGDQESWRDWAEELKIEAPKVELASFSDNYGAELRGMRATSAVESDESIITVPARHALEVTTGGLCPLGDKAMDPTCWSQLSWWAQLAVLLVFEAGRGSASPLAPWISSLPKDFAEIPMNWTDAELALLEYPPLVRQVAEQRAELTAAFAEAAEGCQFELTEQDFRWAVQAVRSRAFSGPYEGRGAGDRTAQLGLIAALLVGGVAGGFVTPEDGLNGAFVAALAIPLTDFFVGSSSKLKRHVVCPVVDYCNHDSKAVSDIAYEYFANAFAVRVRGGFREGDQVCINYGEQRSNDALLQYYGFVERDNPNDVYTVDLLQHLDEEQGALFCHCKQHN